MISNITAYWQNDLVNPGQMGWGFQVMLLYSNTAEGKGFVSDHNKFDAYFSYVFLDHVFGFDAFHNDHNKYSIGFMLLSYAALSSRYASKSFCSSHIVVLI